MLAQSRRGFTLVELLIALVLMGIVAASIYQLLVSNQRIYRQQTQRVELNDNIRSAIAILPGELRELNASDPLGSDIIAMSDSAITYKVTRNLYFVCQNVGNSAELYVDTATVGLRGLDPNTDSLLIFADSLTTRRTDDRWIHANLIRVESGNNCPGGRPSLKLTFLPAVLVSDSVIAGAPVRGFEVVEARKYRDANGALWLGSRRWNKSTGWGTIQPLVGPLEGAGLRFAFFDANGAATTNRAQVARVSITVIGRTAEPVQLSTGGIGHLVDSLVTHVALRNNR
ncbi:MAG TPA: prepilin-type N-terminal cleavage/methylation domain-containing protein [Gemmatimonadales bacterium]|nr:prepilin-type N-terminal cleavage/methylation domain-containing protein [Gemmatimonadales bacterium]